MEMMHCLAAVIVRVDDGAITAGREPFRLGDLRRHREEFGYDTEVIHVVQRRHVMPGNDEDVRWRLRVDVPERQTLLILGNNRGGYFLAYDAAEEAVRRHVTSSAE